MKRRLKLKANLLLRIDEFEAERKDGTIFELLDLDLVIEERRSYNMLPNQLMISSSDKENYKDQIESAINEATILINSIPGLKLTVDQSVSEFIEGEEEEIRKFVSMLVTEM
jgi:hypothetical protein